MKKVSINCTINGEKVSMEVEPNLTALRILRERLDLTGAKEGCGAGECGACTVIVDGLAMNSCLMLAPEMENKIKEVLDKIRPYIVNDGGDVEFFRYENGVVYVRLMGACSDCPLADNTLESGIESALVSEIPEVIKVVNEE